MSIARIDLLIIILCSLNKFFYKKTYQNNFGMFLVELFFECA